MSLSIGILGLPNVGKSTIFNALTRAQNAEAANYPFCTIEPNKAVVPVPDERVDKLTEMVNPQKTVYATVDFVDIAGLVKGASRGEGLGNKFLANVREADALLHVVRCFEDSSVVHVDGSVDPRRDLDVIETELVLADFQTLETRIQRMEKQARADKKAAEALVHVKRLLDHLGEGNPAIRFSERDTDEIQAVLKEVPLLTDKKIIYCANVDEAGMAEDNAYITAVRDYAAAQGADMVKICAKMEEDLVGMDEAEAAEFLKEYGVTESGLDQIARTGYHTLGLISYLTAGPKEVRAWTIRRGWKAPQAAGVIHTDFERGFIRAQVIAYSDYVALGGENACREKGLMRTEGKEYVVRDGDIIEFLFNV
ncbi:MAG: ribosome-binding ATPase [Verrucomicrobiota bacterium]|jgi:GTP-binding protein YchF|nr:ribosome-binding ATPase [Verrucomicrobiota bacterium]MDK2963484.1 ribosome-binding ATPase [Verrucomicrobiota bacterium]